MKNMRLPIVAIAICAIMITSQCGGTQSEINPQNPAVTSQSGSNPIDGKALLQERCSVCHPFNRVERTTKTVAEWTSTVQRMISHGASLTPQEADTLINYLAMTYSK
jgi:hypothetical protein